MRNIHLKDPVPKMFCQMVMIRVKEKLMENMTKYQLGTKKGHRAQEHIFVLKSVMALYEEIGEGNILNLFDISKFFDKEEISDVLGEAHKAGLTDKYYRLIYELNKDTIIKVRTAVGESAEEEIDPGLGQGGAESGILSACSLDGGVKDYFKDSEDVHYGETALKPLLWQDDVIKINHTVKEAQECNRRMEAVLASKNLNFNQDKSVFIVVGKEKYRKRIETEIREAPLTLLNEMMKKVKS